MSKLNPMVAGAGAGAALLLVGAAYFGLSWYSAKEVEKRLKEWTYDVGVEDRVHWKSVSSTPFAGKVTIKELEVNDGSNDVLRIDSVVVSDLIAENERTRVRLQLEGVDASAMVQELRSVTPLARHRDTSWFEQAMFEQPSDSELFVDIDDDRGVFKLLFSSDVPGMYASSYEVELSNQRNLNRALQGLENAFEDGEVNHYRMESLFEKVMGAFERAEIEEARVWVKDRGLLERGIALHQRYNTPLDPSKGSADKQRKAHHQEAVEAFVQKCESDVVGEFIEDVCENFGKVLLGKSKGLELTVEPSDTVRVGDLFKSRDARTAKRLVERLNLEVDTL